MPIPGSILADENNKVFTFLKALPSNGSYEYNLFLSSMESYFRIEVKCPSTGWRIGLLFGSQECDKCIDHLRPHIP